MADIEPYPFVSVVVPAFNEGDLIGELFKGLAGQTYSREHFEIIVVDNGSTDNTRQVADAYADEVIVLPNVSVGGLRNAGAARARGMLLAFLDADCVPEKTWLEKGARAFTEGEVAFGSKVGIPKDAGWIERAWFSQRSETAREENYINSANFFVSSNVFAEVCGFEDSLESGEDTDICLRIRKAGFGIRSRPEVKVVHLKNPKNLSAFVKREVWHGIGGLQSFKTNPFDKPVWGSFVFLTATICQTTGLYFGLKFFLVWSSVIVALILLSAANNVIRFQNGKYFFQIALLYYFYFLGRTGSVFRFIAGFLASKRVSRFV